VGLWAARQRRIAVTMSQTRKTMRVIRVIVVLVMVIYVSSYFCCYSATSKITSSSTGHAQGEAGHTYDQWHRDFPDAEGVSKQIRRSVSDFGLVEEISEGCYEYAEPHDASGLVSYRTTTSKRTLH
jgi:hypothetical protein